MAGFSSFGSIVISTYFFFPLLPLFPLAGLPFFGGEIDFSGLVFFGGEIDFSTVFS